MKNFKPLFLLFVVCVYLSSVFGEGSNADGALSLVSGSDTQASFQSSGYEPDKEGLQESGLDEETTQDAEAAQDADVEATQDADADVETTQDVGVETTQDVGVETTQDADADVETTQDVGVETTQDGETTYDDMSSTAVEDAREATVDETVQEPLEVSLSELPDVKQYDSEVNLQTYNYAAPLKIACETKKLICHNLSSSAITIQGSRAGSALFASFDVSSLRASNILPEEIVSASLVVNKIGGSRTLPIRVDVLDMESNSSRISRSSVLETVKAILPKTPNSPVKIDVTDAVKSLIQNAKNQENMTFLVSSHSRRRFGDILTFPTLDYPNGLSLEFTTTRLPQDSSKAESGLVENSGESGSYLRKLLGTTDMFSGTSFYVASGILITVVVIVIVLMFM